MLLIFYKNGSFPVENLKKLINLEIVSSNVIVDVN